MTIIQINCVYNTGSTGKIVTCLHKSFLESGFDSFVFYGRGAKIRDKNIIKVSSEFEAKFHSLLSRISGIDYGYSYFATRRVKRLIKRIKPDVVHLHCLNGHFINIFKTLAYLKKNNIRTVLTLHAEFMYTANCGHAYDCEKWKTGCGRCLAYQKEIKSLFASGTNRSWKMMQEVFDNFNNCLRVVSVSPWLMERAIQSPFLRDKKHSVILNGVDTSIFYHRNSANQTKLNKNDYQKIILHVTPFFTDDVSHIKGGYYLIEIAKKMPSILFVVAGKNKTNLSLPKNVILLGNVSNQDDLASFYSSADLTVVLSKRETFSMPVAESLCCGTPVVGFFAGGPESIALPDFCTFVKYGDLDSLETAITSMINRKVDPAFLSEQACKRFSKNLMIEQYFTLMKDFQNNK